MIIFNCPHCNLQIKVPDNAAERTGTCPQCKNKVRVPGQGSSAPRPQSAAAGASPAASATQVPCPFCGKMILAAARKCRHCGQFIEPNATGAHAAVRGDTGRNPAVRNDAAQAARVPCPVCGEMIVAQAQKCRFCGEMLGVAPAPARETGRHAAVRGDTGRHGAVVARSLPPRDDYDDEVGDMGLPYEFSGQCEPGLLAVGGLICIPVVMLLSLAYAYAVHYIPLIYFAGVITYFFGIGLGVIASLTLEYTKTRNAALGTVIAVSIGLLALYCSWGFCLGIYFQDVSFVTFNPLTIIEGMIAVVKENSFSIGLRSIKFFDISGFWLALVYLIEAGMIVVMAVLTAIGRNSSLSYCEECGEWTEEKFTSPPLSTIKDVRAIQEGLLQGQVAQLLDLRKVDAQGDHTSLTIKTCGCSSLNVLTINDVTVTEENGKLKEEENELLGNVMISEEAAQALRTASWSGATQKKRSQKTAASGTTTAKRR